MCYTAEKGSVFNLQNTAFEESGSTYDQNAAIFGGAIYMDTVYAEFINATFTNSNAYEGGSLYITGQSTI